MLGSPSKFNRDGVQAAMNALLSRHVLRMMSVQACSASAVTSKTFTPRSSSIATVAAM